MMEHFLHNDAQRTDDTPIAMQVNARILREQVAHEDESFVDHGDERIGPLAPGVTVGDFFEDVRLLGEGVVADLDVHAEVGPHIEGRVDVDQLDAPLSLDLLAQRAVLEAGEDQLVVAPDELVGPALELPPPLVHIEQQLLRIGTFLVALGTRFVHLLNRLKRQNDVADFIRLAVPDQLDLPFVVEQQKPILLRQRLARLQKADDVLLLGVSQSGHGVTLNVKRAILAGGD